MAPSLNLGWGSKKGRGETVHRKGVADGLCFHSFSSLSRCRFVAANGDEICADPKKDWVNKTMKRLKKK